MRRTVRLRLALLYSGLFLVAGVLLVALITVLVEFSPFPDPPAAPAPPGGPGLPAQVPRLEQTEHLHRLLVNSLVSLVVTAFAAMLLGWLMAGRVLRPLGEMTATVRRITADRLDRRLAASGPDDELKELADTFDELLDRVEAAFTAQRRFVANASHELRTPLTLQRAVAEVALADPEADAESLRKALERMLAAGKHQERLIEALLTLARSQQGLHDRQSFDLAAVAGQVIDHHNDPELHVESALQAAPAFGDRALAERLVVNLLDNALRYNVPGGWVRVETAVRSGRPTLRVANSGTVIPADRLHMLLQPFQRLETGRKASGDGLGLGLSIVAAIVEAHQGMLDVRPLPAGGLDVSVALNHPGA
ncbi:MULTISPECIES: sensor histidine kinase [Streptosporangium]|uniref:histidine kinase n=1 Tax=Streptosporangium brasiliense TaxID=47480 RepID=A0ABT9RJH2_9ACTN|nr:ATP-binding protein [Streptosporangium brasiliense]MDP9869446.1 signal transduction histidine kinase [Streptosporangium brasiliense]